jgi:hypothetical protein
VGHQLESGVNNFLVPEKIWCQFFPCARKGLFLWCQHLSGVRIVLLSGFVLVLAFLWCEHFSGTSVVLVLVFLWCQHCSGISIVLVPAFLWCRGNWPWYVPGVWPLAPRFAHVRSYER